MSSREKQYRHFAYHTILGGKQMDGSLKVGHTYSSTGDYGINELTIILLRDKEIAKGNLLYINHPKNNTPVVYQVTKVYPHKRVRDYEEALLKEGKIINDFEYYLALGRFLQIERDNHTLVWWKNFEVIRELFLDQRISNSLKSSPSTRNNPCLIHIYEFC